MMPDQLKAKRQEWGRELRRMRVSKNLNQSDLAKISGISRSTISMIETGYRSVLWDCLIIYREALENYQP